MNIFVCIQSNVLINIHLLHFAILSVSNASKIWGKNNFLFCIFLCMVVLLSIQEISAETR